MLTRRQRDLIAAALRSVIDQAVSEHYEAMTQEHQLTSRIAALLELELQGIRVLGRQIAIITQEFPDKGRGSLERPTGIDLYIGVMDLSPNGFSKGIFLQSKWREVTRSTVDLKAIQEQCERMLQLSDQSYVCLYGPDGADLVRAQEVVQQPGLRPEQLLSRKTDDVFRRILECIEGDPRWGIDRVMMIDKRGREAVTTLMEELRIRTAIGVVVEGSSELDI